MNKTKQPDWVKKLMNLLTEDIRMLGEMHGVKDWKNLTYTTNSDLIDFVKDLLSSQEQRVREEMKEVVKHAQPTFFIGEGLTDKEQQLMDDAVYETRVEIYEQLFEGKKNLTFKDVLTKPKDKQK